MHFEGDGHDHHDHEGHDHGEEEHGAMTKGANSAPSQQYLTASLCTVMFLITSGMFM